jgi:hypothetical protein
MKDSLENLLAKQEITDVLVNYCHYLDRMELDSLGELFSTNCSVIYGDHPNLAAFGRADLIKSLERMWRWQNTAHHISNISIKLVSKKKAQSQSYIYAWHEKPDRSTAVVFGRYIDQLNFFSKGWQIVERRMDVNGCDENFHVPVPKAKRNKAPKGWMPPLGID